jgi:hypothetical protein
MCSARSRARKGEATEHWHNDFVRQSRTPVSGAAPAETVSCYTPSKTKHIPWDDFNLGSVSAIARCYHTNIATIPKEFESHFDRVAETVHMLSPQRSRRVAMAVTKRGTENIPIRKWYLIPSSSRVLQYGVLPVGATAKWTPDRKCQLRGARYADTKISQRFEDHTHFSTAAPAHPKGANGLRTGKSKVHSA